MIIEVICCSWCHAAVELRQRPQWCPACGHRADVGRVDCDCPGCVPSDEEIASDFAADLIALIARGLIEIEASDEPVASFADRGPRFRPTAIAAARDPAAALADLIEAALDRGEVVDELVDALIEARATDEEPC